MRRQAFHQVSSIISPVSPLLIEPSSSLSRAPGEESCDSDSISPAILTDISILHCNIRGFASHRNELEVHLTLLPSKPCIIVLNEIFLDKSTLSPSLSGYSLISRRDRDDCSRWGGICCFAKHDLANSIVEVLRSDVAERSWHIMHSSNGFSFWTYNIDLQLREKRNQLTHWMWKSINFVMKFLEYS